MKVLNFTDETPRHIIESNVWYLLVNNTKNMFSFSHTPVVSSETILDLNGKSILLVVPYLINKKVLIYKAHGIEEYYTIYTTKGN